MSMVRAALKSVCALSAIATVVAGSVSLIASAVAAEPLAADANAGSETITVNNATFTWGVNAESGGGSYFGGCNYLSAGVAGDNGQSGVWLQDSGLYRTSDGNVEILKPAADGTLTAASWDAKCTNQYGTNINGRTSGMTMDVAEPSAGAPAEQPTYSGNVVRIANGTGTVDPATDSAHLTWKGSFTIVYYGGMTYWSLTDPVLDITDGKGTITATASGYGADMDDPSVWKKLDNRQIHLADLTNAKVDLGAQGATVTPDYLGVAVPDTIAGRNPQAERTAENASWWGAMPQSWLEYAELTGQTSYWYTSDGGKATIQPRKPASPIVMEWGAAIQPGVVASATALKRGERMTFSAKNLTEGVAYRGAVRLPDGTEVGATPVTGVASQWTYDAPKDAPIGTYVFELFDEAAEEGAQPVATLEFAVGDVPAAPTITTVGTPGSDRVTVKWKAAAAAKGALPSTGFTLLAKPAAGGDAVTATFAAGAKEGTITGLRSGTAYAITVAETNAVGTGAASKAVTVTTAAAQPTTPGGGNGNGGDSGNGGSDGGGNGNGGSGNGSGSGNTGSGSGNGGGNGSGTGTGSGNTGSGTGSGSGTGPGSGSDSGGTNQGNGGSDTTGGTTDGTTDGTTNGSGSGQTSGNAAATLSNVVFRWGMNEEANSKSFFGACNYLSAGVAGDNGHSGVWNGDLYRASDGNVTIEKPNASGQWVQASWQTRCQTPDGSAVTMGKRQDGHAINTESQVVIRGGTGVQQQDGSISVQWTGSWTVVFYDGMTYWSVSDPKLTLDANGNGSVTATASGYGADMDNSSVWKKLDTRTITLADLKGVDVKQAVTDGGFSKIPEYLGVKVNSDGGRNPQAALDDTNRAYWGSFPQSFVDYMVETGQSSYWYTSDGQRDFAKPATALTVQYDVTRFQAEVPVSSPAATTPTVPSAGNGNTNGSGAGTVSAPNAASGAPAGTSARSGSVSGTTAGTNGATANNANAATGDGQSDARTVQSDQTGQTVLAAAPAPLIADTAGNIALGSGGVALATALPLAIGWAIRRRLGLDASAELDRRLGLR